ncbi:MAG: glycosyltransferase family 39 protein [Armatimonadia bacterium]
MSIPPRLYWPLVACIAVIYLALGTLNIVRLPAINGPDEGAHLQYVQVLRDQHRLPVLPRFVQPGQEALAAEQAQHPPLYYAILAGASYVLPPLETTFTQRAFKFLSLLMGLGGLWALAVCARRLWPEDLLTGLAATASLAFLPMFWVMTSLINNSAGSLLASGVALLLLQKALGNEEIRPRQWFWAGLVVALGMMMKITAAWLVPVLVVAIWARWRREPERKWRQLWSMVWPVALPLLVIVGGWLLRNQISFGEIMPERVLKREYLPAGILTLLFMEPSEAAYAGKLLLFVFFVTIPLSLVTPYWLLRTAMTHAQAYTMFLVYMLPALGALILEGVRRRRELLAQPTARQGLLLACLPGVLAGWVIALTAVMHDWNTGLYAGRYMVDAAPACALLWAAGMQKLLPAPRARLVGLIVWLGALLAVSVWVHGFMFRFFAAIPTG